jgi:hypothetical protein
MHLGEVLPIRVIEIGRNSYVEGPVSSRFWTYEKQAQHPESESDNAPVILGKVGSNYSRMRAIHRNSRAFEPFC